MKKLMKAAFVIGLTVIALSTRANAQTYSVQLTGSGSSGLFLALGEAASYPDAFTISGSSVSATCLWTENTNSAIATDTSTGSSLTDKGSAWVAWTPSTVNSGSCSNYGSGDTVYIYAYLQVDSVVGDRCLFNAINNATPECSVAYPTTDPGTSNLIYPSSGTCGTTTGSSPGECSLPTAVATALNDATVNYAGTDIRPEDAEFAVTRATTTCDSGVASGSSYLGLGYTNGGNVDSFFSSSVFHVIDFSLPTSTNSSNQTINNYAVTTVGASPVVFVVNGSGWPSSSASNLNVSDSNLAKLLDGTYSYTNQLDSSTASGSPVTVVIREPLSGTYNTVEYNVPNTITNSTFSVTGNYTSQDVGQDQPSSQVNCNSTDTGPLSNPMDISTTSGGARVRAIGTSQELSEVINLTSSSSDNTLGYGFWSVSNFAGFTNSAAPDAFYLEVNGVDPLTCSGTNYLGNACPSFSGVIPTTSSQIENVDLHNIANGTYPVWSLLRLVNGGTTALTPVTQLSSEAQQFVPSGIAPNFVAIGKMSVLRSHFTPPAGAGYPTVNVNGDNTLGTFYTDGETGSNCSALPEAGGDVGGAIIRLTGSTGTPESDNKYCLSNSVTNGWTAERR